MARHVAPAAIGRAIRIARAHPSVRDVRVIEGLEGGAVLIEVDIEQQLPSAWRMAGESPSGVRAIETVGILLPADFPRHSPRSFLRSDFDRTHPHLLPTSASQLPQPCVVRGYPSELIQARGFEGYLDQLVDWLDKATMLELNSETHGWEPVRRDHLDDEMIADPEALFAMAGPAGDCVVIRTDFRKIEREEHRYIRVALNPEERLELGKAQCTIEKAVDRPWWRGRSLALIVGAPYSNGHPYVVGAPLPETVTSVADLRDRAKLYGCGQAFEAKLDYIALLLEQGKLVATPLVIVFLVQRPYRLVGTQSSIELCAYVLDLQPGDALLHNRGEVRLCGIREDISTTLLRRASGDEATVERQPWALVGAGSVGSKIAIHMARRGLAPSLVVDRAIMSPHNYARHALLPDVQSRGGAVNFKANILCEALAGFAQDAEVEYDDVITLCATEAGRTKLSAGRLLLNTTGSSLVREALTFQPWETRPVLGEAHLLGSGTAAYAAIEGEKGNPNLSDLAAESYRLIAGDPEIRRSVFSAEAEVIQIGQGCSALTFPLADGRLSAFAAGLAETVATELKKPASIVDPVGKIFLGKMHSDGLSQTWHTSDVPPRIIVDTGGPQVRISPRVDTAIRQAIAARPGVETGGVIVGRYSQIGDIFQVVDLIDAPPDSIFTAEKFTLGTAGLRGAIARLMRDTGGALHVLGTWHNHLVPSGPSVIDAATAAHLALRQFLPVLMLIAHTDGYSSLIAEVHGAVDTASRELLTEEED